MIVTASPARDGSFCVFELAVPAIAARAAGARFEIGVAGLGVPVPTTRENVPPVRTTCWPLRLMKLTRAADADCPADGSTSTIVSAGVACVADLVRMVTTVPRTAATPDGVEIVKFDWRCRASCTAAEDTWARTLPATT